MSTIIEKESVEIENMIYEIRGVQVMIDSDLAKLYQCTNGTKDINKSVKRNIKRFPKDFYFQLTDEEKEELWFQSGTTNNMSRSNPSVFTEQGIAMLSAVLHTEIAVEVSTRIMRSFVKMRHYINYNKLFLPHKFMLLDKKVDDNTKRINELFDKFDPKEIVKDYLFFDGDFYDAYSVLLDILNRAKQEIIIIDNYAGKELLDVLRKADKNIIIVSKNIDEKLKRKYESQYHNIKFIYINSFHDRFIILDKYLLYSCGSSFKDLGKKCFTINEFYDNEYLSKIIEILNL